ncbi:hypothetical protein [Streptomyces sp. MT206]|uniref:hypothetical protein n=1 Tax=Streptomyces sp. MT206 TaxID=3031407 RepID=UPI002FCBD625
MAVTMTATAPDPLLSSLQGPLLLLVRNKLSDRAEGLRGTLPQRPDGAHARFVWWQSLNAGQARQAMLLEHLTMLVGHLDGQSAPGFGPEDVLPEAALQEAEGFDDELSGLISRYRRVRSAVARQETGGGIGRRSG